MRIAIIGTHCTGKTEIVNKLYRMIKDVESDIAIIKEIVRACPFPVNKKTTLKAQEWILRQHLKQEKRNMKRKFVISDRCAIDNYMYMVRAFPERSKAFLNMVLESAKYYDYIFKTVLDESREIIDDGFRDTDPDFRREIDEMLTKFLNMHGIKYLLPPPKDAEAFIMEKILNEQDN